MNRNDDELRDAITKCRDNGLDVVYKREPIGCLPLILFFIVLISLLYIVAWIGVYSEWLP
jgi:hypothetical protein